MKPEDQGRECVKGSPQEDPLNGALDLPGPHMEISPPLGEK